MCGNILYQFGMTRQRLVAEDGGVYRQIIAGVAGGIKVLPE